MGWTNEETVKSKKGMDTTTKILLGIIVCVVFIIILIMLLLLNVQDNTYTITIDGGISTVKKEELLAKIENTTYVNIEEFAKLVKYEYHKGEYKSFKIEDNKCYVQGTNETASFYLNDNKVYKLATNDLKSDYMEFDIGKSNKEINGIIYTPIDALGVAFNVQVFEDEKNLNIFTLDYLVNWYDAKTIEWGYTGIKDQNFENCKTILYGYLIVKKENGLYKIIDNENKKEIISDKYTEIQFSENTKEFFITNSLGQVGILNLDGSIKIDPIYNQINMFDKSSDLYIIRKDTKYGIVRSGNIVIIPPEYDMIGFDNNLETVSGNQKMILDTLIPVCKDKKWGAYNKEGKIVIKIEYDGLGYELDTITINDTTINVEPVREIERCKGIVVKKDDYYGLLHITGKELVPLATDGIYAEKDTSNEDKKYFMIYKGNKLNVIERLIATGLLQENEEKEDKSEENSTTNNSIATNEITNNTEVENTVNNNIINSVENSTVETNSNTINNVISNEV